MLSFSISLWKPWSQMHIFHSMYKWSDKWCIMSFFAGYTCIMQLIVSSNGLLKCEIHMYSMHNLTIQVCTIRDLFVVTGTNQLSTRASSFKGDIHVVSLDGIVYGVSN
jgi:hypothetical protein